MARAARQMTREELNHLRQWQSRPDHLGTRELWKMHVKDRKGRRLKPLCLRAFRNVLNGKTYNSCKETRGRKRKLQTRAVEALNKKRRELVLKANGEKEVSWDECVKLPFNTFIGEVCKDTLGHVHWKKCVEIPLHLFRWKKHWKRCVRVLLDTFIGTV